MTSIPQSGIRLMMQKYSAASISSSYGNYSIIINLLCTGETVVDNQQVILMTGHILLITVIIFAVVIIDVIAGTPIVLAINYIAVISKLLLPLPLLPLSSH